MITPKASSRKAPQIYELFVHYFITKSPKVPLAEEIHLRTKLSLNPQETFKNYIDKYNSILAPFLKDDEPREWALIAFKGESAIEIDENEPISSFNFTKTNRERDIYLCEKKNLSKEKKK